MKNALISRSSFLGYGLLIAIMMGGSMAQAQPSPFDVDAPLRGKIDIAAGKYTPKYKIILGAKVNPTDKRLEPATVTTPRGTEISRADILIDEGLWQAEGTKFAQTQLRIDLGGALVAYHSLFEDCTLSKGGVWFVKWHSSKWTFEDCVFTRQFISPLKINDIGIKAKNCTFYDVPLAIFQFKEDTGSEVKNEWMQMENCRFINCDVPESFLLMTKNCVFDSCTFGRAERELLIKTPLAVTVNLINSSSSKPKAGPSRTINVVEGDIKTAGANTVRYRRTGKTLNFD
ncbi:MAG: hypothetical protein OJI67_10000 [Prosthecobacter sp.]|nr:hypothetical protein [Prosthecobacter sp.]